MIRKVALIFALSLFIFSAACFAATNVNLVEMSLEDLMNVEITSVSKTPQVLAKTPAAVYVINNEDIRRSGRTTIPDLLRGVPGVNVGQVDASTWAVSIRGFQDRFANKLLVLMDGRSVYSPLFSGTIWNIQDTEFEDIDRIEIIRGPGSTAWGANAVQGIINIITKPSKETQGLYAAGGYGTYETGFGDVRYGGKVNDNLHYRFYKKYNNRDRSFEGDDDWETGKFGGRADWEIDSQNLLTVQGDYYALYGYAGDTVTRTPPPTGFGTSTFSGPYSSIEGANTKARGRNVLGRWTHTVSEDSDLSVQAYYDFTYLGNPFIGEARDTYDVDARYRFPISFGVPQELIVGAGYRYTSDETIGSHEVSFIPADRSTDIISWSVQDELRLVENFMTLWLGSKFEDNDYTGFEYQPTARLAIYPDSDNTVWGSITRAVRTPSRTDTDVFQRLVRGVDLGLLGTGPLVVETSGTDDFKSEELLSYEAGVKSKVTNELNVDVAAFYNEYDNLRTTELGATVTTEPLPSLITHFPVTFGNDKKAETYGSEVSVKYFVTKHVRLNGNYSYLHMRIHPDPAVNTDGESEQSAERESPNHQAAGGISLDLPWNINFDTEVRYVGPIEAFSIGDYVVADMRVGWKPTPNWEVSVVGVNLFDAMHFEYAPVSGGGFLASSRRMRPSVYAKVETRF